MSTPPWKKTNSRVNTNNNDILHCDELFTDELVTKNAVLNKKVKISKEVTTNNFDVSNISINDTMEVPDICINSIGRHEKFSNNDISYIEFVSNFSAPVAILEDVRANDSSFIAVFKVKDASLNKITNFDGAINFNTDTSFNRKLSSLNTAYINNLDSLDNLQIHSDVSSNKTVKVNSISLEILDDINNGNIKIVGDVSVNKIRICHDLSLSKNVDSSVIILESLGVNNNNKLNFNNNVIVDGNGSLKDLSVNIINSNNQNTILFKSKTDAVKNVTVENELKTNNIYFDNNITFDKDISFNILKANVSVNKFESRNSDKIIIDCDVSINNNKTVVANINPDSVNFMTKYSQPSTSIRKGTIFLLTRDATDITFKNYNGNYATLQQNPKNIDLSLIHIELYDNSYGQSDFFLRDYSLNYNSSTVTLDASWIASENKKTDGEYNDVSFSSINIRHDVSHNYKFDISFIVRDLVDPVSKEILIDANSDLSLIINNHVSLNENSKNYSIQDDTSFVIVTPITSVAKDISFDITVQDLATGNDGNNRSQTVAVILKYNRQPEWKYMILTPSNNTIDYDSSIGLNPNYDQSWNTDEWNNIYEPIDKTLDVSHTFYVQMMNQPDSSYFYLDLSSIDPEGYEVSYNNNVYDYIIPNNDYYKDISGFVQNNVTDWSRCEFVDGSRIKIRVPEPGNNGIDMSFEIISKDDYLDRQNYQKKIVIVEKVNRQPDWKYMKLSVSNNDLLINNLNDQSWNNTTNRNIESDISNQFYLYFDMCDNYIYSSGLNGSKDLSSYYLDLSAVDFEGYDVSYDVSNVKGDLTWSWVDNSRIIIDISDTVELGSDTSLQIISIDDWVNRPNPEERIVEFKHISSEVIKGFDISNAFYDYNNDVSYNNNIISYNLTDNSYQWNIYNDNSSYVVNSYNITIEPSYNDSYSTFFEGVDYSINSISNNVLYDPSFVIDNNKIDISFSSDLSFNFLLQNIFKYQFNVLFRPEFVLTISNEKYYINADFSYHNYTIKKTANNEYYLKLTNTDEIECKIDSNVSKITVWHVMAGSKGGNGGTGVIWQSGNTVTCTRRFLGFCIAYSVTPNYDYRKGGGGGGGNSGYVIKKEIEPNNKKLTKINVNKFDGVNSTESKVKFVFNYLDNSYSNVVHSTDAEGGDAGNGVANGNHGNNGAGGNISGAEVSGNGGDSGSLPSLPTIIGNLGGDGGQAMTWSGGLEWQGLLGSFTLGQGGRGGNGGPLSANPLSTPNDAGIFEKETGENGDNSSQVTIVKLEF